MPARPAVFRPSNAPARTQLDAEADARRRERYETRRLYGTQAWRKKARAQLQDEPLCRMCLAEDRIAAATVADHVEPHRGDPERFWNTPLQSLCGRHHNSVKQAEERKARR